jgi:hypothetical protein
MALPGAAHVCIDVYGHGRVHTVEAGTRTVNR